MKWVWFREGYSGGGEEGIVSNVEMNCDVNQNCFLVGFFAAGSREKSAKTDCGDFKKME